MRRFLHSLLLCSRSLSLAADRDGKPDHQHLSIDMRASHAAIEADLSRQARFTSVCGTPVVRGSRQWPAYNGAMWTAITREISPALADCQLSFVARDAIDIARAGAQHAAYRTALEALGCEVLELPAEPAYPDSVFVEDVALAFDEVAIATRPGSESRRDEGSGVLEVLGGMRPLLRIESPGTLDGGDVLRIGKRVFVGASARSNTAGHQQLRELLAPHGYTVESVPMRDCLHLKSAVTQVGESTVLINPAWVDVAPFAGYTCIEVDPSEEHAANALRVGDTLVYPDCFPLTLARLRAAGIRVVTVDVSELQKAEGAVTCCCILLRSGMREAMATP
jgi:dimethylargininase